MQEKIEQIKKLNLPPEEIDDLVDVLRSGGIEALSDYVVDLATDKAKLLNK